MPRRRRLALRPSAESLEGRLVPAALTPAAFDVSYGLNRLGLDGVALNGASQTIALIDAYNDPYAALELAVFDQEWGLPAANLNVVDLGSASNTDTGWEGEEALDIEAAHLAAPGATIDLVEAASDSTSDLMNAVNVASTLPDVTVVSMSWGGSDSRSQTAYDSDFNHTSITYLAASGDEGAGAEWPADSPYVIGVGGTSLTVSASDTATSESAWDDSGGGVSRVETEPSYQDVAQQTGYRTTPDVSADADPNDGLIMFSFSNGGWIQVGGTSLATPIWAGLIADANEGRFFEGKAPLDSTIALEDLYNAPTGSFTDITNGYRATSSYDTSTGLGSPNAAVLAYALIADPSYTGSTTGNGVGGDPLPTSTVGFPTNPFGPPGFNFDTTDAGSSTDSEPTGGNAETAETRVVADVAINVGQEAPDPSTPIILASDDAGPAETTSRVTRATLPTATPAGVMAPPSTSQIASYYQAVDAALEALGHGNS